MNALEKSKALRKLLDEQDRLILAKNLGELDWESFWEKLTDVQKRIQKEVWAALSLIACLFILNACGRLVTPQQLGMKGTVASNNFIGGQQSVSSTPTPTPSSTPSPSPSPSCTLNTASTLVSSFNQFDNIQSGQSVTVTVKGAISCNDGLGTIQSVALFSLFNFQIQNYAVNNVWQPTYLTITIQSVQNNGDGTWSATAASDNGKSVLPTLTTLIPTGYY